MAIVGVSLLAVSSVVVADTEGSPSTSVAEGSAPEQLPDETAVDDPVVSTTVAETPPPTTVETSVVIEDEAGPTTSVADTPSPATDVGSTAFDAAPDEANGDGGFSTMAVLDVQPSSYDWGSLRVGEVGPWVPFAIDLDGYDGRIGYSHDAGVQIVDTGWVPCGDRFCINFRFAPHQRGPINANLYIIKMGTDPWETTVVPTTGTGLDTEVAMSITSLDFGDVAVGSNSAAQTVTFSNVGDFDVDVTAIQVTGPFTRAGGTCASSGAMAPGTDCTIDVAFSPTAEGPASGSVEVSTAQEAPATAALSGIGLRPAPVLEVTPTSAVFNSTPIGSTSRPVNFTVSNPGTVPVAISSIVPSPEWFVANGCPSVVAAGTSCQVQVTFAPTGRDLRTGTLTVTSEAPTVQVALSGHGLGGLFRMNPTTVEFGTVDIGDTSATTTVTVTNTGWISTEAQPSTAAPFAIESTTCEVLAPDESCTAEVSFSPTARGPATGTFTVTGPPTPPDTIPLIGFGAVRTATLAPTSVDFGAVSLAAWVEETVELRNTGNVALQVTGASAPDQVGVDTTACAAAPLAPEATCAVTLRYEPDTAGPFAGTLTVATSFGDLTASLAGTGLALNVAPDSLFFDPVTVGHEGSARFTVTNFDARPMTVSLTIPGAGPYRIGQGCPASIAGHSSCDVTVTFAPSEAGQHTARLLVSSDVDGSAELLSVDLGGRGVAADLRIDPIDVGPVALGDSATSTATITNGGVATVAVSDVTVPAPFSVVSAAPCVGELTPQASCNVDVMFTPTTPGAASVSLAVHHLAGETSATVQGFGVTTGLRAAPSTAGFGRVLAGATSEPIVVTVTNLGNVDAELDAATVGAPFEVVDDGCDAVTLAAEQTCEISVRYAPAADAAGDQEGTLGIAGTSGGRVLAAAVELTGFAAVATIDVAPAAHDFGTVAVGRTAPGATTTITNTGNVALLVGVGDVDDAFTLDTSACAGVSLEPGASCDVVAGYAPTAPGTHHASSAVDTSVELADGTHAVDPIEITLDGVAAAADLVVDPDAIDFGEAAVGLTTDAHPITVTNHGPDVGITTVAVPDGFITDTDGCAGVTLAIDETCEISVRFEPASVGTTDGVLTITGDAADADLTVALTGLAPESPLTIGPAVVDFGDVSVGERSPAQSVTVVNDSNATVTVTGVDLQGATPAGAAAPRHGFRRAQQAVVADDFELSAAGCLDLALAPGESCTISVIFAPRAAGPSSSPLRFETDGGSQSITLTGTGVAATPANQVSEGTLPATALRRPSPPSR